MNALAKHATTTPIPVQLSAMEGLAFLFLYLTMPTRGAQCKLGSHRAFHLIFEQLLRSLKLATGSWTDLDNGASLEVSGHRGSKGVNSPHGK